MSNPGKSFLALQLCLIACGFEPVVSFLASPISVNAYGLLRRK